MKHPKLVHLKPAALALAMAMSGQNLLAENMDPIEWCSRAGSESARITCLEEALRNKTGQTPSVAAPETPKPISSIPSVPDTTIQQSIDAKQTTPKKNTAKAHTDLESLGSRELDKRNNKELKKNEHLRAHVTSFKFVGYRKLWVKLKNGQIWQQKKSDRSTLESRLKVYDELDVELWRTGFGGYRLHIPKINKTVTVIRLK